MTRPGIAWSDTVGVLWYEDNTWLCIEWDSPARREGDVREWGFNLPDDAVELDRPRRDDEVATWIKTTRDRYHREGLGVAWHTLDDLLDEYRLRADMGLSLAEELPEDAGRWL